MVLSGADVFIIKNLKDGLSWKYKAAYVSRFLI
jgi:hypothetical protein